MRKQNRVWKKIKEGKLKKLTAQLLWMYLYVRRYWLLIAFYVLLGASGSVLSLGFSLVTRDLVDAVTGMNTKGIGRVVALYVGVGVGADLRQRGQDPNILSDSAEGDQRNTGGHL